MHDDAEIQYYRSVEDLFAALRGVRHILSPKDFQLMRRWWSEQVPYEAVAAGLTEVFTRRRERDGGEPASVTNLSYCRHAVASHARRLREARVGSSAEASATAPASELDPRPLASLAEALGMAEATQDELRPAVAHAIRLIRERVEALPNAVTTAAELDEALFTLEAALLQSCFQALDDDERRALAAQITAEVAEMSVDDTVIERTARALTDHHLRTLLGLPRLELP